METDKTLQLPQKVIIVSVLILVPLVLYSLRYNTVNEVNEEENYVSLCQIRAHFDGSDGFDDRTLVLLLATLKLNDFLIGQPAWGPPDTLLYMCEHLLKNGLKRSKLDKELRNIIKTAYESSTHLSWTCA